MRAEQIRERLLTCGIPCDESLAEKLSIYMSLLTEWNTRMDLTAVTEEEETLDRHFKDSLLPVAISGLIPVDGSAIDVGTGAGFPGLPLAMAVPSLRVTLLDSQQKRLDFLAAVIEKTGTTNAELIHARAEDAARMPAMRERYDLAMARAVAPLPVLAEYLIPFTRVGGRVLCWKGPGLQQELRQGRRAAHLLGGRVEDTIPVTVPGRDWNHQLLPIAKIQATPKQYPRRAGIVSKLPLG